MFCCLQLPSILKKQIVALTGAMLSGFVVAHLAGNFMLFLGPEAFNHYAAKLQSMGPLLYAAEVILVLLFITHIYFTLMLVLENWMARPQRYEQLESSPERSIFTRLMPYSGLAVVAFVVWHLLDFKFNEHHGMVAGAHQEGLYARVYEAFTDPLHSGLYIVGMFAVGFHLAHAIQSLFQTFGLTSKNARPLLVKASLAIGIIVALSFSSMPVYIMAKERSAIKSAGKTSDVRKGGY